MGTMRFAEHLRGQYSQALNLLHQAELLAPTLPQVHLNLALILESQGNTSSALRHYRQYLPSPTVIVPILQLVRKYWRESSTWKSHRKKKGLSFQVAGSKTWREQRVEG